MKRITISKSTGLVVVAEDGKRTEVKDLPPQASLKAVMARLKALGLVK